MSSNKSPDISIVVPAYNSEKILPHLVTQLAAVMSKSEWSYEVIFVCDYSPDASWDVISSLAESNRAVRGILLSVNAGQHNALMAGFQRAKGNVVITMDDDLQHDPAEIPKMIEMLDKGYDVVYARFISRQHPTWKVMGSKLNDKAAGFLIGKPKELYLSPFRAIRGKVIKEILRYRGPYVYVDGLIVGATRRIGSVEVEHHERFSGESRYGFGKSISLWLKMATNFSILPLRLTSLAGLFFASLGFLLALAFVIQKFTLDVMPDGWASLIVTILTLGGVQLLGLGIIGEYLGRVLLTINARPQYVVGEEIGFGDS